MVDNMNVETIKQLLREFAKEREWEKFHNPKNLAMALVCESGELLEIFCWLTEMEANNLHTDATSKKHVAHELADILLYAVRLSDLMQINLTEAIMEKIEINRKKYPVSLVKGSSKKYNHYAKPNSEDKLE